MSCPGKCWCLSAHDQTQLVQFCIFARIFQRPNHGSGLALPWNGGTYLHFLAHVLHCWMASNKAELSSHKIQIFPSDTSFFPWITRWEPCVKLCPGHRAGQARSCVALTGTYRKGGGASRAPAEISRHQQPTLPSEIIHRSSHDGRVFTGTDLAALGAAHDCKLGHGFLALLPQRLCDHPCFTQGAP